MIAGIILAAGASSRMGRPKALLDYGGETFIARLIRVLSARCDPVIVVLGYHADEIRAEIDRRSCDPISEEGRAPLVVINPAPERGQLSSMQTALAALPAAADGFMFVPVDCPGADPSTIDRIARSFVDRDAATLLIVPQYRGKHGHPVCAARSLADEFLALPPDSQAREVVHRHKPQTVYVDVDDPGILTDVDDPETYRQMLERNQRGTGR